MIWQRLKHFSKNENWGNPDKMNGLLLITLDEIRDRCDNRIIIHCGTQGQHVENSRHYTGDAVDFHVENMSLKNSYSIILNVFEDFQIVNKTGLGIYLDWKNQGFHLDLRPGKGRWARIEGKYTGIEQALRRL